MTTMFQYYGKTYRCYLKQGRALPLIRLSYALYITRRYTIRSTDNTDTCRYFITFFIDLQEFVNYFNIEHCTKIMSFVTTFYEFCRFIITRIAAYTRTPFQRKFPRWGKCQQS